MTRQLLGNYLSFLDTKMLVRALILTILIMLLVLSIMSNVALRQANSSVKRAANDTKMADAVANANLQMSVDNLQDGLGVASETNASLNISLEDALSRIDVCQTKFNGCQNQLAKTTLEYNSCTDDQVKSKLTEEILKSEINSEKKNYDTCTSKLNELVRPVSLYGNMELNGSFNPSFTTEKFSENDDPSPYRENYNPGPDESNIKSITDNAKKRAQAMVNIRAKTRVSNCNPSNTHIPQFQIQCLELIISEILKVDPSTVRVTGISGLSQDKFGCVAYMLGYIDRPQYVPDKDLIYASEHMGSLVKMLSKPPV